MKKRIIVITSALIVLLLCFFLIFGNVFQSRITKAEASGIFSEESEDDEDWNCAEVGEIAIENDKVALRMNCETTHFTVTDKQSGKEYRSVPAITEDFAPNEEQLSEVIITYYDVNSTEAQMTSYENSVQRQSFEIKTDGEVIRVYYSIQKSEKKIFVPETIGQETFEEDILSKLESGPKRRLKGFYYLTDMNGESVYTLNDAAEEHNYSEITSYMEMAGYDETAYAEEAQRLGLEDSIGNKQPAAFTVPVEYALKGNGFTATVLTDRITSDSSNYKMTDITLLPYFGSCGYTKNGWFLVPDGSGAIIEVGKKDGVTYRQDVWGTDQAVEASMKSNLMQNVGFPIFAFHNGEDAYFAEVSGAAAVASINVATYGKEITQNHIYTDFRVLSYDTSDIAADRKQAAFNIYASDYIAEFPQVTYTMFPEKDTTYSDMANFYREVLISNGMLGERLENKDSVPVYIDFTGYETYDKSFLGVTTKGKTTLSTVRGIENSLDELEGRGLSNLQVRLKAYANDGTYGTVSNGFEIDTCVGTQKELDALAQKLRKSNGRLYLENNISTVYSLGNSFEKMTHAVRNLKKTVVRTYDYDLIARTNAEAEIKYYLTSPAYYSSLTENFINTLFKESDNVATYGYSWSDYGSKLWSDFNRSNSYDRAQSMYAAKEAMKKVTETFEEAITDGSNAYALAEVDAVLNIPLNSSALRSESYSIPFYQMVVHGYIDYAGAPMNTGADMRKTYLATIESGANLYYSFYTSEDEPLKESQVGTLIYPTLVSASYDVVEAQYAEINELFKELRGLTITEHTRVAENAFTTTYEDGTQITVNYSNTNIVVNGETVLANNFTVTERGDGND